MISGHTFPAEENPTITSLFAITFLDLLNESIITPGHGSKSRAKIASIPHDSDTPGGIDRTVAYARHEIRQVLNSHKHRESNEIFKQIESISSKLVNTRDPD